MSGGFPGYFEVFTLYNMHTETFGLQSSALHMHITYTCTQLYIYMYVCMYVCMYVFIIYTQEHSVCRAVPYTCILHIRVHNMYIHIYV